MKTGIDKSILISFIIAFMLIDLALATFIVWRISGNRNTYCDGIRLRQEIREYRNQAIPATPDECLTDNTKLKRIDINR